MDSRGRYLLHFSLLAWLVLLPSCRLGPRRDSSGLVRFRVVTSNGAALKFAAASDTLLKAFIRISRGPRPYIAQHAQLSSGAFVADFDLPPAEDYYAEVDLFLSRLVSPAFQGVSDTFAVSPHTTTNVTIVAHSLARQLLLKGVPDTMDTGDLVGIHAEAVFPGGGLRDVTSSCRWDVLPGLGLRVTEHYQLLASSTGQEQVVATYRNVSDSCGVYVR